MMRRATINRLLAAVLTLAALGLWGASGWVGYRAWPTLQAVALQPAPAEGIKQRCVAAAKALGFSAEKQDRGVRIRWPKSRIGQIEQAFNKASILIPLCESYELESFCAGRDCGQDALFLSLRPAAHS